MSESMETPGPPPDYPPSGYPPPGYPPPGYSPPSYPPQAGPPSPYGYAEHPGWGYAPMPSTLPPYGKRANGNAFAIAGVVGAVVWLAVGIFHASRSVHSLAFVAGESFATALIAAIPVAIIAWASRKRWPLWRYPTFIVPIAVGATLLSLVGGDLTDSSRTQQRRTATAPAAVGAWTRDASPAATDQLQQAKDNLQLRLGADAETTDMALYRRGGERAVLMVVTTRPGSGMDNDTRLSPRQAVTDELAGAGVDQPSWVDAGPLGGALGCGASAKNTLLYMCTWAELGMVGTLMLANTPHNVGSAAQLTRDFRSRTEH